MERKDLNLIGERSLKILIRLFGVGLVAALLYVPTDIFSKNTAQSSEIISNPTFFDEMRRALEGKQEVYVLPVKFTSKMVNDLRRGTLVKVDGLEDILQITVLITDTKGGTVAFSAINTTKSPNALDLEDAYLISTIDVIMKIVEN